MLDFPASGYALLSLFDKTGIRPEYALPVLELESGLTPSLPNLQGYPYYGLNQIGGDYLSRIGVTPSDYLTWPASRQLTTVVTPFFQQLIAVYGPIRSATRLYQANLLPSTLSTAKALGSVIAARGSSRLIPQSQLTEAQVYSANSGLDADRNGEITVADLASKMRDMLSRPAVQDAIARTYALRPGWSPVSDPIRGDDFTAPSLVARLSFGEKLLVAATAATAIVGVVALVMEAGSPSTRSSTA